MDDILSIEAAIEALPDEEASPAPEPQRDEDKAPPESAPEEADALADTEDPDADPEADEEDGDGPDEDQLTDADDEEAQEDDEGDPDSVQPIAPPQSWGDDKALEMFAQLDPALQQQIAAREADRDKTIRRVTSEAGEARKASDEAARTLAGYAEQTEQLIQAVGSRTAQEWHDLAQRDWNAYAAQLSVAYETVVNADAFKQVAANSRTVKDAVWSSDQAKALQVHEPDAYNAQTEVQAYLKDAFGVPENRFDQTSAVDRVLAYKAMLYDRAQTTKKDTLRRQKAKPAPKSVKSSPAQAVPSSQRKKKAKVQAFDKNPSIENAINLI